jgi:hypothetical protein
VHRHGSIDASQVHLRTYTIDEVNFVLLRCGRNTCSLTLCVDHPKKVNLDPHCTQPFELQLMNNATALSTQLETLSNELSAIVTVDAARYRQCLEAARLEKARRVCQPIFTQFVD